jgi:hypothetical protein
MFFEDDNIQKERNDTYLIFKKIYSIFDIASFKSNKVVYYDIEKNKSDEQLMLDLL